MTRYEWLDNKENKADVYNLLRYTLEEIQPDELPFLDGIYDNYIDLARQGSVDFDDRQRPFNFTGAEDVISVWLIPLAIEVANTLIITAGIFSLKKSADLLMQHRAPNAKTEPVKIRDCIHKTLDELPFAIDQHERTHLENALVQAIQLILVA